MKQKEKVKGTIWALFMSVLITCFFCLEFRKKNVVLNFSAQSFLPVLIFLSVLYLNGKSKIAGLDNS